MSFMESGLSWFSGKLNASAGVAVTYTRNTDPPSSAPILAVPVSSRAGSENAERFYLNSDHCVWRVRAADIDAIGTPQVGDTIADADGNTWEVCELNDDPCFEVTDQHTRTDFRIRTRRVANGA